ncbi:MAG: hypothetical protein ABIR62_06490 [Dokdonella sp.]|uniref:hypothetical protein n=1 Tax=Dokdonella sp. TaxID=2291710 RepID=UPI0032666D5B
MTYFRAFEVEALRLLGNAKLGSVVVEAICRDAEFVSYSHSGVGYFLTVRHHLLPNARMVLSKPVVLGQVGEVAGSYLAFVENTELMLEYAGTTDVPENFRDLSVQVAAHSSAS